MLATTFKIFFHGVYIQVC